MRAETLFLAILMLVAIGLSPAGAARANEVGDQVITDTSGYINGAQSFVDTFELTTWGTLTVEIRDRARNRSLDDLKGFISSGDHPLTSDFGPGTESIKVGPGFYSVQWFAGFGGDELPSGRYRIEIEFKPGAAPVPVPAPLGLLASGLALLAVFRRGRRPPAAA